jgi:hypothetical protein
MAWFCTGTIIAVCISSPSRVHGVILVVHRCYSLLTASSSSVPSSRLDPQPRRHYYHHRHLTLALVDRSPLLLVVLLLLLLSSHIAFSILHLTIMNAAIYCRVAVAVVFIAVAG